jgi:putative lipoic acid-binding regulatory protein
MMQLYQVFDELKYTITTRESKNGKYISASFLTFVLDANQVTDIYQKVAEIEGIMML